MTGVNTLFNAMLNNPDFLKMNFSSLKVVVAGGMAPSRKLLLKDGKSNRNGNQ